MSESERTATTLFTAAPPVTRTFLVADIRGYTRFTIEHGDAAGAQLSQTFLDICKDVLARFHGEFFGEAGDQALVAFSSATEAVQAALALQARLTDEQRLHPDLPLVAGIGLDTGEAVQVGSDYRGTAVNRAARLCSIAGGTDILVSDAVVSVARIGAGISAVDRGEVTLKGLLRPVRVLQIGVEGALPTTLPPLQPALVTHPTNLPDVPTPFIGRSREIAEITGLLRKPNVRLVTLVGPGGTGKTRLAMQVASDLLFSYDDGVFFADLSPLTDPNLVLGTIAEVLAIREETGKALLQTLIDHLKDKDLLLVLDNWEQIIDAAGVVGQLLDSCRQLTVLATSRVPLHLAREWEYAVDTLATPDSAYLPPLDQLMQYDAIAFFVDRASAVQHSFSITPQNAKAIAAICVRLDGLPLALELAAARLKLFPPQALLDRLDSRLKILTGGARDRPGRQQTLRGTIDWSYNLLLPTEKTLFARLSIFAGGCDYEAAEAICNFDGTLDILDGLSGLVEKSLVKQDGEGEPRFLLLETIREYAAEKRLATGENDAVSQAHALYWLKYAKEAEQNLTGAQQADWCNRVETDLDNLRAAMSYFLDRDEVANELQIASALRPLWYSRGYWTEGRHWLQPILSANSELDENLRSCALFALGELLHVQGKLHDAVACLEQVLTIVQHPAMSQVQTFNELGNIAVEQADWDGAVRHYEESLKVARELGDPVYTAGALANLGLVAQRRGNLTEASKRYEESLVTARRAGNKHLVSWIQNNRGSIALKEGRLDEAEVLLVEALSLARESGIKEGIIGALCSLSELAVHRQNFPEAQKRLEEALAISREIGHTTYIAVSLIGLAGVLRQMGDTAAARSHLHEAASFLEWPTDPGIAMMALHEIAHVLQERGRPEDALLLLAREATERAAGSPYLQTDLPQTEQSYLSTLQTSLGPDRFNASWQEGQTMPLRQAMALAVSAVA